MTPTAGCTAQVLGRRAPTGRPARRTGPARRHPAAAAGIAVAVFALVLGLTSCGGTAQAGSPDSPSRNARVAAWTDAATGASAVERQADAQAAAATEAARADAAGEAERTAAEQAAQVRTQGAAGTAADPLPQSGGAPAAGESAGEAEQCTTRPEDRAACTMPEGAEITPDGGDVDGDGVFEKHEPVGPAYKDPRAYDGGRTSGELQCAWARQQGYGC